MFRAIADNMMMAMMRMFRMCMMMCAHENRSTCSIAI